MVVHEAARPVDDSGQMVPASDDDPVLTAALQAARRLLVQR
jgi:hypothetical protein